MRFLWLIRPYFRQVAGQLFLGSVCGIVMNTAVVLPAILLGAAIDKALALERGQATGGCDLEHRPTVVCSPCVRGPI